MNRGQIITFYSYKGGVGRTMALANVATLLAQQGKRVLAIDFDLEAPGLHRYLLRRQKPDEPARSLPAATQAGVIELFGELRKRMIAVTSPDGAHLPADPCAAEASLTEQLGQ